MAGADRRGTPLGGHGDPAYRRVTSALRDRGHSLRAIGRRLNRSHHTIARWDQTRRFVADFSPVGVKVGVKAQTKLIR
jgi:hypothetical protein